jgi:signal transduction histidine kinase
LLSENDPEDDIQSSIETIRRSANGLLMIINDILDLSKVESGTMDIEQVQFSLSTMLREMNETFQFSAAKKSIAYESAFSLGQSDDLIVQGDPGRVRQILLNLGTNGIKFTSHGKVKLTVTIHNETIDHYEILFQFEDTGVGLKREDRTKLFLPFTQANSSTARHYGGTGLGLAISKKLAGLMHGTIKLESEFGVGTTVQCLLPLRKSSLSDEQLYTQMDTISERLQGDLSVSCN